MEEEYFFTFPIGDWSNDGHGQCIYYTVKSNKPAEQVIDIHYEAIQKFGINVEEIASEYEDSRIDDETVEQLFDMGFKEFIENVYDSCLCLWNGDWTIYGQGMAYLWVFLLLKTDEDLKLEFIPTPPMLSQYGYEKHKRTIGFVGYGCFH